MAHQWILRKGTKRGGFRYVTAGGTAATAAARERAIALRHPAGVDRRAHRDGPVGGSAGVRLRRQAAASSTATTIARPSGDSCASTTACGRWHVTSRACGCRSRAICGHASAGRRAAHQAARRGRRRATDRRGVLPRRQRALRDGESDVRHRHAAEAARARPRRPRGVRLRRQGVHPPAPDGVRCGARRVRVGAARDARSAALPLPGRGGTVDGSQRARRQRVPARHARRPVHGEGLPDVGRHAADGDVPRGHRPRRDGARGTEERRRRAALRRPRSWATRRPSAGSRTCTRWCSRATSTRARRSRRSCHARAPDGRAPSRRSCPRSAR